MPEGPEVRVSADILRKRILNAKIVKVNPTENAVTKKISVDLERSVGKKIIKVSTHGKKIFFKLSNGNALLTSYLMEGRWLFKQGKHTHIIVTLLLNKEKFKIYYEGTRFVGSVKYINDVEEIKCKLGIDPLKGNVRFSYWELFWRSSKIRYMQIAHVLLDQSVISGVGNYLRSEILYLAKIHPHTLVKDLSEEEMLDIKDAIYKIMTESYELGGFTIKSFISPNGKAGRFTASVYMKELDPLDNKIKRIKCSDGRDVFYVPRIQKLKN